MSGDRQNVVDIPGTRVDDDHLLSMYVDNELDAERTIALISRLRSEPALRERLEVMEANDKRVRQLFTQSDKQVPEHLAPLVAAENVAVLGMTRRWQRWASVAVAASCAIAIALVVDLNQTDVFNPMAMDPQLAKALEQYPSRATGWDTLDAERQFRSVLTFPAADGRWCREFLLSQSESHWRGVACRDGSEWVNQVVGSEVFLEQESQYRPAGAGDSEQVVTPPMALCTQPLVRTTSISQASATTPNATRSGSPVTKDSACTTTTGNRIRCCSASIW